MVAKSNARSGTPKFGGGFVLGLFLIASTLARAQDKQPVPRDLKFPKDVGANEIAGVVVDSQGKPLADVLVDAWTWYTGDETRTDANGVFRFKPGNFGAQRVEIRFSKPGYSPHYVVQQPRGQKGFLVTLGNQTYLDGTVRDIHRKPVAGATIVGEQGPQQADGVLITHVATSTTSDAKGHYRLYLFPDRYEIQASAEGVGNTRRPGVFVSPGKSQQLDIDLKPGVRFEAMVVDADTHQPVQGLVLFNWRDKRVRGISDAMGKLVIEDLLPGKYEFNVGHGEPKKMRGMTYYDHGELGRWWSAQAANEWQRKTIEQSGWQRNFDDLSFELSSGMKPVTIEVEKGVVFSGRVLDPDGNAVFKATVAPALTGTGNSLTGDTRYSATTAADGSYRVVMPAGNESAYNLVAHDGTYNRWRKWANAATTPMKTKPGQRFENFDLKLTRGATVRGRVIADGGRRVGNREVRAQAADLLENRYYDPTVKVLADGSFELKFIRPGKNYVQLSPFWLRAADASRPSSVQLELQPGEVREGIELDVDPWAPPADATLGTRNFRISVLDDAGRPAANHRVVVSRPADSGGGHSTFKALVGTPGGLAKRLTKENSGGREFTTGADGTVTIPGRSLFDRRPTAAIVVALDADREEGAFGVLYADSQKPELTLRLSAFCDTTATISKDKLSNPNSPTQAWLTSGGMWLAVTPVDDRVDLQLPMGNYSLTVGCPLASQVVNFAVKANQERLDLGAIALTPPSAVSPPK
jgi:hypothetical protein